MDWVWEKTIPLRIINMINCDPSSSLCTAWKSRYNDILRDIDFANQALATAGVQFWMKSFEAKNMPHFADLSNSNAPKIAWSLVRSELSSVIFTLFSEWDSKVEKTPDTWLRCEPSDCGTGQARGIHYGLGSVW